WFEAIDLVLLRPLVLSRASEPLPTAVGTLDAIHLATARLWRERHAELTTMATHDASLGLAARTFGFEGRGVGRGYTRADGGHLHRSRRRWTATCRETERVRTSVRRDRPRPAARRRAGRP